MSDLNGNPCSDFDDIISNYESGFLPSDAFLDNFSSEVLENDLSFDFMEFNEQTNADYNLENELLMKPLTQSTESFQLLQQPEQEPKPQLQQLQQQLPIQRKLQLEPEQNIFLTQNQKFAQPVNVQVRDLPQLKQTSIPKQVSVNEPQITHIQSQNVFVNQQPISSLVIPQLFYTTENLLPQQTQSPIFLNTNLIKTEPRTVICQKNMPLNSNSNRLENKVIAPAQSTTTLLTTNIPIIIDADKLPIINQNNDAIQSSSKGKRKSHNAIERKYRTSINEKINQLKNIVVGVNAKLNKSGILKKTIELITSLMKNNEELRQENLALKLQQQKFIKIIQNTNSENRMNVNGSLTPPQSETSLSPIGTDNLSIPSSPDVFLNNALQTTNPLTEDLKLTEDKYLHELMLKGMGDHSRLALCMFLFGTFSMNPINVLYNLFAGGKSTDGSSTIFNGRTILGQRTDSYQETNWLNFNSPIFTIGFFNFLMFFICFLKFFVFYDYPNLSIKSKQSNNSWQHRKQVEFNISKGYMDFAEVELKRCLNVYSFSLPVSKLDLVFNVACQIIRQILHRIWIGRFISQFAGGFFVNKNRRHEILNSRKDLAMNFHYLSQIHLIKNSKSSLQKLYGLMLALNAVNLAEASGALISPENLVDIYAGLILRIRTFIPSWLRITRRLYFELARKVRLNYFNEMPARTRWIFSKYGSKFFLSRGRVDYYINANISDTNMFCSLEDASNPMCYVLKVYKEHLMRKAMQILLSPGQKLEMCENKPKNVKCTQISDALYFVKLLMETVYSPNDVSVWWIHLMTISTYWHLNEDSKAEQLYDKIRLMPNFLENLNDPLPKSIHTIFKARALFVSQKNCKIDEKDVLKLCDEATKFLEESLALGSCKKQNFLIYYFQLLTCDWILETRMNVWEDNNESEKISIVNSKCSLSGFQKSLSCLRILTQYTPAATPRVYLYEAVARLMAGAAPGRTQLLLDRSLKNRNSHSSLICGKDNNDAGGEKQHAQALYVACKYLPGQMLSIPGERAGMLTESISLLERIGEKKQCLKNYQFIKKF